METKLENKEYYEFLKELNFYYSDKEYEDLISEMWMEYISSDSFCSYSEVNRKEKVHRFKMILKLLQRIQCPNP